MTVDSCTCSSTTALYKSILTSEAVRQKRYFLVRLLRKREATTPMFPVGRAPQPLLCVYYCRKKGETPIELSRCQRSDAGIRRREKRHRLNWGSTELFKECGDLISSTLLAGFVLLLLINTPFNTPSHCNSSIYVYATHLKLILFRSFYMRSRLFC